jgi:predicted dehydrogenase
LADRGRAVAVAAVDADPAALVNAQAALGLDAARCFTADDAAAAFAVEADFVVIVVPPAHHERYVGLAIDHGLAVLSEKPMADDLDACARILAKVERTQTKMAVTMSHRFDADKQTLSRAVGSGRYGALSHVVCRFATNARAFPAWGEFRHRMADPLVVEGAVHHFDILREVCAADAAVVSGTSWNPPWGEYAGDTTALFTFTMTNGVRATYEGSAVNASHLNGWAHEYVRAECELATLELHQRRILITPSDRPEGPPDELPLLEQDAWVNPWLAELFCDWVEGGAPPPNTAADNIQCAAMVFGAIEAARTGGPVDVQQLLAAARRRV